MKAIVDKEICVGCGLCEDMCPQIFFMEQDGKAAAKDIEVPLDLEDLCRDTAEQCPVEAIMISE